MALVPTFKVSAVGAPSANVTTGAFTPSNNSILVAVSQQNLHGVASLPSISGGGLTWTKQAQGGPVTSFTNLVTIWTAPVSTGASMTVVVSNNVDGAISVSVTEFTGHDTGTPIGLTHQGGAAASRSGSYAGSMGGTTAAGSYVIGAGSVDTGSAGDVAVGSGYTTIASFVTSANDFAWSRHEYKAGALSTFDYATLTTSFSWAAAAIEVKAAAGAVPDQPYQPHYQLAPLLAQ